MDVPIVPRPYCSPRRDSLGMHCHIAPKQRYVKLLIYGRPCCSQLLPISFFCSSQVTDPVRHEGIRKLIGALQVLEQDPFSRKGIKRGLDGG